MIHLVRIFLLCFFLMRLFIRVHILQCFLSQNMVIYSMISVRYMNTLYIIIHLKFSTRCSNTFPMWGICIPRIFYIFYAPNHTLSVMFLFEAFIHNKYPSRRSMNDTSPLWSCCIYWYPFLLFHINK